MARRKKELEMERSAKRSAQTGFFGRFWGTSEISEVEEMGGADTTELWFVVVGFVVVVVFKDCNLSHVSHLHIM